MQITIASINPKFNQFPTPRNNNKEKIVKALETIKPRLEFAKIREKVNSTAVKKVIKSNGITPKVCGSTK